MTEMVEWLRGQIEGDKKWALRAAELCGCHPPAPSWIFGDETTEGRIVIVDDPHPDIRRKLSRKWNGTYEGLFAAEHIVRHDPRDTIARCEAELEIIDEHEITDQGCETCGNYDPTGLHHHVTDGPCKTLRLLIRGYRHREGWKDTWKP